MAEESKPTNDGLIPIQTIEPGGTSHDGPFVPQVLSDDPDTGDGSVGRKGFPISKWRLRKLDADRLGSVSDPTGRDRQSRRARKVRRASRRARTEHGRKTRGRARVIVAAIVVLLIAAVMVVGATYALELWGGKTIPNVVGLSQNLAIEQLEERGFEVTVQNVPSDILEGHVVSMNPEVGQRVPATDPIVMEVSEGRKVPKVVGLSRDEARKALKDAGATHVRLQLRAEGAENDVVLEVRPPEGSAFMSSGDVTLIVSQLPNMPDVLGKTRSEALKELEQEGIPAAWEFERSDVEHRQLVVRTEPEAGGMVPEEGARVFLGDPLVEVMRLADYFDTTAPHAVEFLQGEGFISKVGHRMDDGHVVASFQNGAGIMVAFVAEPWAHAVEQDTTPFSHVVDTNMRIEGVRMLLPPDAISEEVYGEKPSADEATAQRIMASCGFDNMLGSCTRESIVVPPNGAWPSDPFYCCYGEMGNYVWTILLRTDPQADVSEGYGEGSAQANEKVDAVVTCAPRIAYESIDLSANGNRICDYVAYQDQVAR